MSNRLIKFSWNLGNVTFHMCGLDKEKNFLISPQCECGCGGKTYIILNTKEEITNLEWQLVADNDCNCCAVFVILEDNSMVFAYRHGEDIDDISVYETNKIEDYSDSLTPYGLLKSAVRDEYRHRTSLIKSKITIFSLLNFYTL